MEDRINKYWSNRSKEFSYAWLLNLTTDVHDKWITIIKVSRYLEAKVRMLESIYYRLYTNQDLSTGQMNELIRIITKEDLD